jgi:hypothetical protein
MNLGQGRTLIADYQRDYALRGEIIALIQEAKDQYYSFEAVAARLQRSGTAVHRELWKMAIGRSLEYNADKAFVLAHKHDYLGGA